MRGRCKISKIEEIRLSNMSHLDSDTYRFAFHDGGCWFDLSVYLAYPGWAWMLMKRDDWAGLTAASDEVWFDTPEEALDDFNNWVSGKIGKYRHINKNNIKRKQANGVFTDMGNYCISPSGLKFYVEEFINESWSDYDKAVAEAMLSNYGEIYVDEYGQPIDNEYDQEEISHAWDDDAVWASKCAGKTSYMYAGSMGVAASHIAGIVVEVAPDKEVELDNYEHFSYEWEHFVGYIGNDWYLHIDCIRDNDWQAYISQSRDPYDDSTDEGYGFGDTPQDAVFDLIECIGFWPVV